MLFGASNNTVLPGDGISRRGEILYKHNADGGSLSWRYVALKTGAGNSPLSRWSSRKEKKKNEGIYFCFYVRYQFHVVTTLCVGAARLGFRQNTRSGWGRDDVLALLVPSPQKQLENVPTSRQKSLVLSRIQMLKHHVKEWRLAWQPSHPVVTPTPSPSGRVDM